MSFLKTIFDDQKAFESLGIEPRIQARAAGVDSFFCEAENDGHILVEHPDGSVSAYRQPADKRLKAAAR